MTRIFHFTVLLILSHFLIGFEGSEDLLDSEKYAYRNSNNSDQNACTSENTVSNVVFKAYNRNNSNGTLLTLDTTERVLKSILLQNKPTTFITHGWLGSENGSYLADIRKAYLHRHDMNVIVVGWSKVSRNEYAMTTFGVAEIGATVGKMVRNLLNAGLVTLNDVHLVGHSLGAHVMGTAGRFIQDSGYGKVGRITGLDPARPGYEQVREESVRLDRDDGQFVDIIHTSGGVFGYLDALGHADFYPNGGYNYQPGCSFSTNVVLSIFCSHIKALEYFKESIYNETAFPSVECDSFFKYTLSQCEHNKVVYMGQPTPSSTQGTFYLQTITNGETDGKDNSTTQ